MSIETDVNLYNAFHQAETDQVLKMAQELYKRTNAWREDTFKPKTYYWRLLIKSGCLYSINTLANRWNTINGMPELMKYKTLPVAFSIYRDIVASKNKLGLVNCRALKYNAEKNKWSYDTFFKHYKPLLNEKPDKHLCHCPICNRLHRPLKKTAKTKSRVPELVKV